MLNRFLVVLAGLACLVSCATKKILRSTLTIERERLISIRKELEEGGGNVYALPAELVLYRVESGGEREERRVATRLPIPRTSIESMLKAVEGARASGRPFRSQDERGVVSCDAGACTVRQESAW